MRGYVQEALKGTTLRKNQKPEESIDRSEGVGDGQIPNNCGRDRKGRRHRADACPWQAGGAY